MVDVWTPTPDGVGQLPITDSNVDLVTQQAPFAEIHEEVSGLAPTEEPVVLLDNIGTPDLSVLAELSNKAQQAEDARLYAARLNEMYLYGQARQFGLKAEDISPARITDKRHIMPQPPTGAEFSSLLAGIPGMENRGQKWWDENAANERYNTQLPAALAFEEKEALAGTNFG